MLFPDVSRTNESADFYLTAFSIVVGINAASQIVGHKMKEGEKKREGKRKIRGDTPERRTISLNRPLSFRE